MVVILAVVVVLIVGPGAVIVGAAAIIFTRGNKITNESLLAVIATTINLNMTDYNVDLGFSEPQHTKGTDILAAGRNNYHYHLTVPLRYLFL